MGTATRIDFSRDRLVVHRDGHKPVKVSISRFPALATASPEARLRYTVAPAGDAATWPALNFTLKFDGLK